MMHPKMRTHTSPHPVTRYLAQELNAFDEVEAALAEALQQVRAVRGRYERDLMANHLDIRSTWEESIRKDDTQQTQ